MPINKPRTMTRVSSVSWDVGKVHTIHHHATAAAAATVLAAGYFNDWRGDLAVNDSIFVMAAVNGVGDWLIVKVTAVPASGDVTVAVNSEASGS